MKTKGFYLIECVIAMLMMSFILSIMVFVSLKLYEDTIEVHDTIIAKIINLSVKQVNFVGLNYDANSYASTILPNGHVSLDKSIVTTFWQIKEKQCEAL